MKIGAKKDPESPWASMAGRQGWGNPTHIQLVLQVLSSIYTNTRVICFSPFVHTHITLNVFSSLFLVKPIVQTSLGIFGRFLFTKYKCFLDLAISLIR